MKRILLTAGLLSVGALAAELKLTDRLELKPNPQVTTAIVQDNPIGPRYIANDPHVKVELDRGSVGLEQTPSYGWVITATYRTVDTLTGVAGPEFIITTPRPTCEIGRGILTYTTLAEGDNRLAWNAKGSTNLDQAAVELCGIFNSLKPKHK